MSKIIRYIVALIFICSPLYGNVMFEEPVNLGQLNSADNDFAPSWNEFEQSLYFTSDMSGKEKLYISQFNLENDLQIPKLVKGPINIAHKNLSYISFLSPEKAYFSTFKFINGQPELQLFYSNYKKQSWTEGFIIDEIENDRFTGHSTISDDGNQLIFTQQSDEGDLDLMISYRMEDGTWREPIPLDIMNSNGNEITPHITSNDTLYFASDGQGGPGGYDLYFSIKSEGNWQRPSPLYEINTEYSESDVSVMPNGDIIFASDRPGGKGKLDLWVSKNNKNRSDYSEGEKLKIDIQSFISKIVITNDYNYENLPVSKAIYLSSKSSEISDKFFDYSNSIDIQSLKTIDEAYEKTLNIIGSRLKADNSTNLTITAVYPGKLELGNNNEPNSKHFADVQIKRITEFLTKHFNIESRRINYSYNFYQDKTQQPRIEFSSNNPSLFDQLEIRNDNIVIDQQRLPIEVSISPEQELSYWLVSIKSENTDQIIEEKGEVSDRLIIDLNKYKQEVFNSNYVNIVIKAYNKMGDSTVKSIPHSVEHHTVKKPKLTKLNNSHYNINYIVVGNDDNADDEVYKESISKVIDAISVCKSIDIVYNQSKNFAFSLKDILNSKIVNNVTSVNVIKKQNRLKYKKLDENLIEIRIEKY